MANLEDAIKLAVEAHWGQQDKAGAPYVLHPLRLMLQMRTEAERMAAVLHDVVEDAGITLDQLRQEGHPEAVVEAVDCLTDRDSESYEAFVERIKPNPLARRVKIADIEDNLDLRRLPELKEKDLARLNKYLRARSYLLEDTKEDERD